MKAVDPLLQALATRSLGQLTVQIPGVVIRNSTMVLPEKCAGFGDIEVRVEDDIGLEVRMGRFTHAHFEFDPAALAASPENEVVRTVDAVRMLLERVVRDEIVFFSGLFGIGGFYPKNQEGILARALPRREEWVWSGPLKR